MAKRSDEIIKEGKQDYLTGIPIAQKDIFCAEGWKTTCGSKMLDNFISPYDATVISKFNNVGAVNLGKTNMDEFAMGSSNETSYYGNVKNPWNIKNVPGGSSGGSAAALAAGLTGLEAGSDIGGSIRNPAHYCGVYGHKPTHAIIPSTGHELVPNVPEPDLSVCGPLARSAEDLSLALDIMSGPFGEEAVGWKLQLPEPQFKDLKDLKVAIWATDEMAQVASEFSERELMVAIALSKAVKYFNF